MHKLKKKVLAGLFDVKKNKQMRSSLNGEPVRRRANISMVQNVLLIWFDSNIDEEHNEDYRNTIIQLRRVVNSVNTFTDADECVTFLSEISDDKVCMIISGTLGQHIVPMVHDMSQLDSVFIFCNNKTRHDQWAKEWPKIKGVFTEITPVCEALAKAAQECEHNSIGISFMSANGAGASNENLDRLDCSFMYTQILKEILLTIKFDEQHIKQFIEYCREVFADNDVELKSIKQFERKYRDKTPICWYTYECFLYPMLNRALRIMDVDIAIKIAFFIGDLHCHIERLHEEQFCGNHSGQVFTVYRGHGLSKLDFEQLINTKGGLISFNSFLSTSKDRGLSLDFARHSITNPDLVGILFVMTIDPSIPSTPFASISKVRCFQNAEVEVLFSMHTVFRIREMKQMSETNRLWQVDLTLTGADDKNLQALTERMREQTLPDEQGWYRLGSVLLKMDQLDKAQQVYEIILKQTTDDHEKANIYSLLGSTKVKQGEYEEALTLYQKSHEIYQKIPPSNHLYLAASYNNIGIVYRKMGNSSKALSYYNKDLEIQRQILPPNHPDLAASYNNIGTVYETIGEYSNALSSYEKGLEIRLKILPPNHPDLAASYNNIGAVYYKMKEYSKALSYYEKDVEINRKILPANHPDLGGSYYNIGLVHGNMGEYSKALSSHEKALEIRQQILPPNHSDLGDSYNKIGAVYYNMGEYSKALSSYEKALNIRQKSHPPNHHDLATSYNNIGLVNEEIGEYSKALSFYERAVDIAQRSLPANHTDLQKWRNNLDLVKKKL